MQLLHQLVLGFPKWKWSSCVQVTRGKMADFGVFNSRAREIPSMEMVVIAHGEMADFGERKENCRFSGLAAYEGKFSYQSFSLMVSYHKM